MPIKERKKQEAAEARERRKVLAAEEKEKKKLLKYACCVYCALDNSECRDFIATYGHMSSLCMLDLYRTV